MIASDDEASAGGRSVSTLLLIALWCLVISLLVVLAPYDSIKRLAFGEARNLDWFNIFAEGMLPLWSLLIFILWRSRVSTRNRQLVGHTTKQEIAFAGADLPLGRLALILQRREIEVRVVGDAAAAIDDGSFPAAPPHLLLGSERNKVLFSAIAWRRLSTAPSALAAVLAHEAAHVEQRDMHFIVDLERFLKIMVTLAALIVLKHLAISVAVDAADDADIMGALVAGLSGKGFIIALLALSVVALLTVRFAERFREAMADRFATALCGPEALRAAELLLAGSAGKQLIRARPWARLTAAEAAYARSLVFLFGFSVGALSGYLPSPLAFIVYLSSPAEGVQGGAAFRDIASAGFAVFQTLFVYFAMFLVAHLIASQRNSVPLRDEVVVRRLVYFGVAVAAGFVATQHIPLMLTGLPIFDRFPAIHRHEPFPLLLSGLGAGLSDSAICGLVAGLFAGAARLASRKSPWVGVGAIALTVGVAESYLAAPYTRGLAAPVIFVSIVLATYCLKPKSFPAFRSSPPIAFAISAAVIATLLGWSGLGHAPSLVVALDKVGLAAAREGRAEYGLRLLVCAATLSPFSSRASLDAANIAILEPNQKRTATWSARRALASPTLSSWSELFEARAVAAEAHLLQPRTPKDLLAAREHLSAAESMWRRNARLPITLAVAVKYNLAVLSVLDGGPILGSLAMIADAVTMAQRSTDKKLTPKSVAQAALDDPDFERLGLGAVDYPQQATIQRYEAAHGLPSERVETLIREGVSREELARLLASGIRIVARR